MSTNENETGGTLDLPQDELRDLLSAASGIVSRLYEGLDERPVFHGKTPEAVRALFDEGLPELPSDPKALLSRIERDVFNSATLNISPNFFGFIMSGGNQLGMIAELLAAAINQNCAKWSVSACHAEMERVVIRWLSEFVGFKPDAAGTLVSGGSVANLTALSVARKVKAPYDVSKVGNFDQTPMTAYVSSELHFCHERAMDLLGLGRKNLRKIRVKKDHTIDLDALKDQINSDRSDGLTPFCVIGNAGTVNTGAVDPLNALADICFEYGLWFHIDAAYGGPAAGTSLAKHLFAGIDRADSISLDPHKWLYAPFEAGCVLVRNEKELRETFSWSGEFLGKDGEGQSRTDYLDLGLQLSRNFKALKIWLAFKGYGAERIRASIEENIKVMQFFSEMIDYSADFEQLAPSPLSIVCFRYRTKSTDKWKDESFLAKLNKRLASAIEEDRRVFVTGTVVDGKPALRACCVNHRVTRAHVSRMFAVVREIAEAVALTP